MTTCLVRRVAPLIGAALIAACGGDSSSGDGSTGIATETTMPSTTASTNVDDTTGGPGSTSEDETGSTGTTGGPGPNPGERVECDNTIAAAPAGAVCDVQDGDDYVLIEAGSVLAGLTLYENGTVLYDSAGPNGRIVCVGCDCANEPEADNAKIVSCADGVVSPALINPHEHLTFSLSQPQSHGTERYEHRQDWREGLDGHTEINRFPGSDSSQEGILFCEMRQLFGGAASVSGAIGFDDPSGLLRNLDNSNHTEGLQGVDVDYTTFPLGDIGGEVLDQGCAYPDIDSPGVLNNPIYMPHIAEGIDHRAQNEFDCLSGAPGGEQLIASNTTVVHGIGVFPSDIEELADAGGSVVWSPRSNIDLYGITTEVTTYRNLGVPIAIGTDWSASGSMNMPRELHCADQFNQDHLNGRFADVDLFMMATYNAALSQGAASQIGLLKQGLFADIAIFDGSENTEYRAIIDADPPDVALVLRGGQPLHGDADLVDGLASDPTMCDSLSMCGVDKSVCVELDTGLTLSQIQNAVHPESYELFFCGDPDNETSCDPAREDEFPNRGGPQDPDGDGIVSADDNCPAIFNPILLIQGGSQGDVDDDGRGDACDVCPFDADQSCDPPDPYDKDGDGEPDPNDNCPEDPNDDQADADDDGVGDACDECPDSPNPGGGPCEGSIYDIKDGTLAVDEQANLSDVLVTAVAPDFGFFVQVHPDDDDFVGSDFSGLFVFHGAGGFSPQPGDRVSVSGTVTDFFGQIQLSTSGDAVVESSGNELPPVEPAAIADIVEGGNLQEAYEGILVRVSNVTVTDIAPAPGPGDSNPTDEFEVAGGLRVNDLFHLVSPFPQVDDTFAEISGVLRWANDFTKLEPRDASDFPVELIDFGPAQAFLLDGTTDMTTPEITVQLSQIVAADTVVALTYEDDLILDGPAMVTVAQGTDNEAVTLTGVSAGTADVTASFGAANLSATVRVYDDSEARIPTLARDTLNVLIDQSAGLTVSLNLPAPATGPQTVQLSALPGTFVTVPGSVDVLAGELDATFMVTALSSAGVDVVTADIAGAMSSTTVNVLDAPPLGLILAEVYYDHTGAGDDGNEWVKLYNGTGGTIDLSTYSLGWGGTDYTYGTLQLTGSVAAGDCYLIGGPNGDAASGNPVYDQTVNLTRDLQNGGTASDGVALFDVLAGAVQADTVPIHAVIYDSPNTNGLADENGPDGDVDVGDAPAENSIRRHEDGTWQFNPAPTPNDCLPFPA